jgi:hypothetical protein
MNPQRFDEMTRAIGRTTSRRGVLKWCAAGLVTGLTGRLSRGPLPWAMAATARCNARAQCLQDAEQDRRLREDACRTKPPSEIGQCMQDAAAIFQQDLRFCDSLPSQGCDMDHECCNGTCVILCDDGQIRDASCTCTCPPGTEFCISSGACLPPCPPGQIRDIFCGACVCPDSAPCPPGQIRNEVCICTCPAPTQPCFFNQGCLDPASCTGGRVPDYSHCECTCLPGTELCFDRCLPPCPPGRTRNQHCECVCPAPSQPCLNGQCIDPSTCTGGRLPDYSQCECVCGEGQAFCNGTCIDVRFDPNNCGDCGAVCPQGAVCNAGVCQCPPGQEVCTTQSPRCVDVCTPPRVRFPDCTCACAPVSCPPGQTQNPTTCQCACAPVSCVPGQTQNSTTCLCECTTGTTCGPFCCPEGSSCCGQTHGIFVCSPPGGSCCGPPPRTCAPGTFCCGNQGCCLIGEGCIATSGTCVILP